MAPVFNRHRKTGEPILFVKLPLALFPKIDWTRGINQPSSTIAEMSDAALRMYLAILAKSNETVPGSIVVQMKQRDFTYLTGINDSRVKAAREELKKRGLIDFMGRDNYILRDPVDGSKLLTEKELVGVEEDLKDEKEAIGQSASKKRDPVSRGLRDLSFEENETYFEHYVTLQGAGVQRYACCPFHDDIKPSLSVNLETGKWSCHAGSCGLTGNVYEFEKLIRQKNGAADWDDFRIARNNIAEIVGDPELRSESEFRYNTPLAVYHYCDKEGKRLFSRERRKNKGFPVYHMEGKGKVWGLPEGIERVLYNLPKVAEASVVCLTEGEKDADRVMNLRLVDSEGKPIAASTALGGTNAKWLPEYSDCLRNKRIVILPDIDAPSKGARNYGGVGMKYARSVRDSLITAGIPECDVHLVDFEEGDFVGIGKDGDVKGGDVSDFLDQCPDHEENCPKDCQAARLIDKIDKGDWIGLSPVAMEIEMA